MEYLFGFVFALFKIAVQAAAYATLLRWLVQRFAAKQLSNKLMRSAYNGQQLWQRSFVVVYVSLFLFSLTYWGDHGLGDSARIPLGHGEEVAEIDGTQTSFEGSTPFMVADMAGAQQINDFQVVDGILCGQAEQTSCFIYNLVTKESQVFATVQEYNAYATVHGLSPSREFQPFWEHYHRYWGGWRFWLLA